MQKLTCMYEILSDFCVASGLKYLCIPSPLRLELTTKLKANRFFIYITGETDEHILLGF